MMSCQDRDHHRGEPSRRPLIVTTAMVVAMLAGTVASVTFPALLPTFQGEWRLSNAEAGWISGVFFAGYVVAVPVLTSLTDRVDPRRVFLAAMALSGLATAGFGLSASGVWTASVWRGLQGVGFAGTYMPGMKALTDLVPERVRDRSVACYTATFTVGTGVSFLLSGALATAYSWRWAFGLLALGPVSGYLLAAVVLPQHASVRQASGTRLLDFRPVLANKRSVAYMVAYAVHLAEASTMRAWCVALLAFSQMHQMPGILGAHWSPTVIAMAANLIGLPAIVMTNELAQRYRPPIVITVVMIISALTGIVLGWSLTGPFWVVLLLVLLYGLMVPADAGTINAGLVAVAPTSLRGATMALHALCGFTGAFLGPVLFGTALDLGGGVATRDAWIVAFVVLAVVAAIGPCVLLTVVARSAQEART
jgi:MFS family permease